MGRVYIVPGVAASTLWSGPLMRWIVYSDLMLGRFGVIRLADDGVSPGDGGQLLTTSDEDRVGSYFGFLPGYYDALHQYLETKVKKLGHDVACYPYDWRLRNTTSGRNLALRIMQDASADDPCYLVCHSMGGIVARFAWYHLGLMSATDRVKRIVTLGTPHQGAYSVLQEMYPEGFGNSTSSIYGINGTFAVVPRIPGKPLVNTRWKPEEIVQLLWTFPSTYELMPQLGGSEAAADPDRFNIFGSDNYRAERKPHVDHLTYARDTFGPLFRSAACTPPTTIMVTAAGYGFETRDKLLRTRELVYDDSFGKSTNGDQTVMVGSATIAGYYAPLLKAKHPDLPEACTKQDMVYNWLFDENIFNEPLPKLVPQEFQNTLGVNLPWPPLPVVGQGAAGGYSNYIPGVDP